MRRPIGEGRRGRSTPTPGREAARKVPVGEIPQRGHQELRNQFFAGSTSFNWVTNNEGYSGIRPRSYPSGSEIQQITMPVTTIDELLAEEVRQITFMKLDLEGGEFCALRGTRQIIARHGPIIVFENGLEWTRQFWDYT